MNYKKFYAILLTLVLLIGVVPKRTSAVGKLSLTLTPGCNEIVLKWKPIEGVVNYQPYLFLSDGSTYPIIDFPANVLTFTHKGLSEGQQYCYEVRAYDKNANVVAKSEKVCAKTTCESEPDDCLIVLKYTVGKT